LVIERESAVGDFGDTFGDWDVSGEVTTGESSGAQMRQIHREAYRSGEASAVVESMLTDEFEGFGKGQRGKA
jgi:hypothetical protein